MVAGSGRDAPLDLVVQAAAAYLPRPAPQPVTAVGIAAGRIVALGTEQDLIPLAVSSTKVIKVRGGVILPGFQDAHIHPPHAGLSLLRCDLHGLTTRSQYIDKIRGYLSTHPRSPWVLGGGWTMSSFHRGAPSCQDLDALIADRPAFLTSKDGHDAWVNTRALEIAGIARGAPDPPDGRIGRTPSGEITGPLSEGAMGLVERHIPAPSQDEWEEAICQSQAYLHSLGITAWQDAHVDDDVLTAYLGLLGSDRLTARVTAALWWERHGGLSQITEMIERRTTGTKGLLRATSVKIMLDGIIENCTAAVTAPYFDFDGNPTESAGLDFIDPQELAETVTALDRHGFQVHFHAVGDRAVRRALDACEAARLANGPHDARHHVAHVEVIHPTDIPRFSELGVVANIQPLWAVMKDQMREIRMPLLGPERSRLQYPFASLHAAGAALAGGSDWSVSTPDPLAEIEVAMTRVLPETRQAEPFMPEQRLGLGTALDAFTRGTAFVNRLDQVTGTIERDRLADIAVLDTNILANGSGPVADARVALTLVGGEVVYANPATVSW